MKKISKNEVKGIIRKKGQVEVLIVPHRMNIRSPWVDTTKIGFASLEVFESYVINFTYHHCNNRESGFYPAYYID